MKIKRTVLILIAIILMFSSCKTADEENTTIENTTMYENTENSEDAVFEENTTLQHSNEVNSAANDLIFYGTKSDSASTLTSLEPLDKIDYFSLALAPDGNISSEVISHSYGVASGEVPHEISINNQKFFDEKNFDAVCLDNKTNEKVLYLTFDCGYENGYTSKILDVLKEKNVTAAFFCTLPQMKSTPDLIARMINEGHIVGNHSVNHPDFTKLSHTEIINELKGFDDYIRENYGYSSMFFRYPEGKYSEKTLTSVNNAGFRCVFWSLAYADWDLENQKGSEYAKNTVLERIHPGAVILLHSVSPDNANALSEIIDEARKMGYEFRSLAEM